MIGRRLVLALLSIALAHGQDLLHRAAQLDAEGKCSEAEICYRRAVASGPPAQALLNNFGNHYMACGQPEKARAYFERVLRTNPAHANANLQLARIAVANKQGSKALHYLSHLPDSDPFVAMVRAEALHWAEQQSEAVSQLDEIEKHLNGDSRLLFLYATTCADTGLFERAETAFNQLLLQNPTDSQVLLGLAHAAVSAQHYDRAEQALIAAFKVQPNDSEVSLGLGQLYSTLRDYPRAVYFLAKAKAVTPQRPEVLLALAQAAQNAQYYGDALSTYDEYLRVRPFDETARRERALVLGWTGTHGDKGIRELDQYLRKHPSDAVAYYDLGQLSWKQEPNQALTQLSTALRLDPHFSAARYSRGWLLHRLGRDPESLQDLQAAQNDMPRDVGVLTSLGLCYLSLDRPSEAEQVLRQAQAISPEDPQVLMHLGRALMDLGRENEAEQMLQDFQKVRLRKIQGPLVEPRMIELANLSPEESAKHEIERLLQESRAHPDDAEVQFSLAELLLSSGRTEEARSAFRQLLTMNAGARTFQDAGTLLLHFEEYGLAKDFLQLASVDRPSARIELAAAVSSLGDVPAALASLNQVPAELRNGDYFLTEARILQAAGQSAEADKMLSQGLHLSISGPSEIKQAAAMLIHERRDAEALNLLNEAVKAHPEDPDLLLTQAVATGLSDGEESEKIFKRIESRWPEWDRAYLAHGVLLEQSSRLREAEQKLKIARALGSKGHLTTCAMARATASPSPDSQCDRVGLRDVIAPSSDKP
jgi:tetratricopeptide (TPR) repeat protein